MLESKTKLNFSFTLNPSFLLWYSSSSTCSPSLPRNHTFIPSSLSRRSSPPLALHPNPQSRRYACGIPTSVSLDKNYRHLLEFIAVREMLDCPYANSFWLCAEDFRSTWGPALPPASDRILPKFDEVYEGSTLDDLYNFRAV